MRSLVRPEQTAIVACREWFFCDQPDCDVVYFTRDGRTLRKDALEVRVGLKENDAPRPVCYCFGHTVESIREEIGRTGRSTTAAAIKGKIEAGECRCEVLNPKGTCCLGDVNKVVKEAVAHLGVTRGTMAHPPDPAVGGSHDCCRPVDAGARDDRGPGPRKEE